MKIFEINKEYPIRGVGISKLTTKLLKRDGDICLFVRSDKYYEVGIIAHASNNYTFPGGNKIEKGDESYFSNEDFGKIAWTSRVYEHANELYNDLIKRENKLKV